MGNKPQKPDRRQDIPDHLKPADWLLKEPHRPPNATGGTKTEDEIYRSVGQALTAWEHLETLLALQFGDLCSPEEQENWSAVRAYGSVLASGTRCDMLVAAADHVLHEDALPSFQTFIIDVRKVASLRNLVAHGMTVSIIDDHLFCALPNLPANKAPFFHVTPPYNSKKTDRMLSPSVIYTNTEIDLIFDEIVKLTKRYALFRHGQDGLLQFGIKLSEEFPRSVREPDKASHPALHKAEKRPPQSSEG